MKLKNKILISILVLSISLNASFLDDLKEKALGAWNSTKEYVSDIKEHNTTKKITNSSKQTVSDIKVYLKTDDNQSVSNKVKQVGNEAIEYTKDTYKELVK